MLLWESTLSDQKRKIVPKHQELNKKAYHIKLNSMAYLGRYLNLPDHQHKMSLQERCSKLYISYALKVKVKTIKSKTIGQLFSFFILRIGVNLNCFLRFLLVILLNVKDPRRTIRPGQMSPRVVSFDSYILGHISLYSKFPVLFVGS